MTGRQRDLVRRVVDTLHPPRVWPLAAYTSMTRKLQLAPSGLCTHTPAARTRRSITCTCVASTEVAPGRSHSNPSCHGMRRIREWGCAYRGHLIFRFGARRTSIHVDIADNV